HVTYHGLRSVTVNGRAAPGSPITYDVQDTAAGATTVLRGGPGQNNYNVQGTTGDLSIVGQGPSDVVVVGASGSVQAVHGTVSVQNSVASGTALTVDDSADTAFRQ